MSDEERRKLESFAHAQDLRKLRGLVCNNAPPPSHETVRKLLAILENKEPPRDE